MNTYKVTYVTVDASTTGNQQMAVDSVAATDYTVGDDFVTFLDTGHQVVAAYATHRVVSIVTVTPTPTP